MKITNNTGIPWHVVSAMVKDDYDGTGFTATSLIMPPRILQLRARHHADIVVDASSLIFAFFGRIAHKVLETVEEDHSLHERRMSVKIGGHVVSAKADQYITAERNYMGQLIAVQPTIRDYKFIKTASRFYAHKEWEQQLNILRFIWVTNGYAVENLEIIAIYRDWDASKAFYDPLYPPPIQTIPIPMWDLYETKQFIQDRIFAHKTSELLSDETLPYCTPEEQWRMADSWKATYKSGKTKTFTSLALAKKQKGVISVERQPGRALRCERFCDVVAFCNQYKEECDAIAKSNPQTEETETGPDRDERFWEDLFGSPNGSGPEPEEPGGH